MRRYHDELLYSASDLVSFLRGDAGSRLVDVFWVGRLRRPLLADRHARERERIGRVMGEERGNKRVAALRLGLSRRTLDHALKTALTPENRQALATFAAQLPRTPPARRIEQP